jgi:hypothetical protein
MGSWRTKNEAMVVFFQAFGQGGRVDSVMLSTEEGVTNQISVEGAETREKLERGVAQCAGTTKDIPRKHSDS